MTSLLPLLLPSLLTGLNAPMRSSLLDQNFGVGLHPDQLILSRYPLYDPFDFYYRPWTNLLLQQTAGSGKSVVTIDKNMYKILLDVNQFKPEEIEVKIVGKNIVVVGKHEEKKDEHGSVARQFERKYFIPDNVDPDTITSTISSDGVLTVQAPLKPLNEKKIKIELTGKPALKPEEDNKVETKEEEKSTTASTTADADSSSTTQL